MIEIDETKDVVDLVEDDLRKVAAELERIGRKVCNMRGSAQSHLSIGAAVEAVQSAIHSAYHMRED